MTELKLKNEVVRIDPPPPYPKEPHAMAGLEQENDVVMVEAPPPYPQEPAAYQQKPPPDDTAMDDSSAAKLGSSLAAEALKTAKANAPTSILEFELRHDLCVRNDYRAGVKESVMGELEAFYLILIGAFFIVNKAANNALTAIERARAAGAGIAGEAEAAATAATDFLQKKGIKLDEITGRARLAAQLLRGLHVNNGVNLIRPIAVIVNLPHQTAASVMGIARTNIADARGFVRDIEAEYGVGSPQALDAEMLCDLGARVRDDPVANPLIIVYCITAVTAEQLAASVTIDEEVLPSKSPAQDASNPKGEHDEWSAAGSFGTVNKRSAKRRKFSKKIKSKQEIRRRDDAGRVATCFYIVWDYTLEAVMMNTFRTRMALNADTLLPQLNIRDNTPDHVRRNPRRSGAVWISRFCATIAGVLPVNIIGVAPSIDGSGGWVDHLRRIDAGQRGVLMLGGAASEQVQGSGLGVTGERIRTVFHWIPEDELTKREDKAFIEDALKMYKPDKGEMILLVEAGVGGDTYCAIFNQPWRISDGFCQAMFAALVQRADGTQDAVLRVILSSESIVGARPGEKATGERSPTASNDDGGGNVDGVVSDVTMEDAAA